MWKKASFALLLAVVASWSPSSTLAQNAAAKDVLITLPVNVDGSAKDLQLLRGETYEDAAISFARVHGLLNQDDARVRQVVDQLSSMLRGRMEELQAKEATKSPPPTVQVMYPLTVNGETREFKKYVGESVHEAVERFLIEGSYTTDLMRELYPQLTNLLNQRLEEIQPARKQLFEFRLILDGREVVARHFEGGDPVEEARETAASVGVTDPQIIGQIANEIRKQIPPPAPEAAPQQPQVAQQQQQQPPLKEVFSMPLTMNDRPTVLVHYDGYTSRESAAAYLAAQGVAEDPRVMEQLISIIDNRVAELARQRAEEEAAQAQAAEEQRRQLESQQQAAAEEAARSQRQPIVQLPINFGDNQVATLQYFEGDSIERTAELFLSRVIGLEEGPAFAQNAAQLSQAIRAKLQSVLEQRAATQQQQQPPQPETPRQQPLVTLPVNLSGRVFDLVYYPGEQPATVANNFCVEKHETIRAELGLQFDGDQLLECKNLLENTLRNMIAAKEQELAQQQQQQQQEAPQQAAPVEQQTPPQRQRGAHLLSLDIDVNGVNQPLNVHEGDNIEQVVAEFLSLHRAGPEYAETLVKAINEQLASLQK